ncbi:hypothetical protein [Coralloluteibacterium thermophilus]|uniref:Uncharacterized protein n=1 Tax=Coralloluteibacterium thermophilum TaxID=2707049 RepID=A0ABV9NL81_9GAMM
MSQDIIPLDATRGRDEQLVGHVAEGEVWASIRDSGNGINFISAPRGSLKPGQVIDIVGFSDATESRMGPLIGWRKFSRGKYVVGDEHFGADENESYWPVARAAP